MKHGVMLDLLLTTSSSDMKPGIMLHLLLTTSFSDIMLDLL